MCSSRGAWQTWWPTMCLRRVSETDVLSTKSTQLEKTLSLQTWHILILTKGVVGHATYRIRWVAQRQARKFQRAQDHAICTRRAISHRILMQHRDDLALETTAGTFAASEPIRACIPRISHQTLLCAHKRLMRRWCYSPCNVLPQPIWAPRDPYRDLRTLVWPKSVERRYS